MTEFNQERQDRLRYLLRVQAHQPTPKLPSPLQRLGSALWDDAEDITHAECRRRLAAFIDDELAGESVAQLYPAIKHHLDRCESCVQEYAELLDTAWAEQRGLLSKPQAMPRPDLSFLPRPAQAPARSPSPTPSLQEVVWSLAHTLITALGPGAERELTAIAAPFFARVTALGAFQLGANPAQALGIGRREANPALTTLAACYTATQVLVSQITLEQFNAWLKQGTLKQELQSRANTAAREIGIDRPTAAQFARAYAEQIQTNPTAFQALLKPGNPDRNQALNRPHG